MSYQTNDKGEVVLTMNQQDYEILLMALGSAVSISQKDRGVPSSIMIPFLNRLMQGNPQYRPYAEHTQ